MCGLQCILDNELCSYTIGRRSQTFLIFMTIPLFFSLSADFTTLSSEGTSHAPFFRLFFSIKITAAKGENAVNGLIFKKDRTQVFFQKRQLYLPVPMSNKSKRQF